MIGLGYGSYPPVTWGEALVWTFAMLATATMFAVMNGFIIATILSSASSRHRYKERMDMIVVRLLARCLVPVSLYRSMSILHAMQMLQQDADTVCVGDGVKWVSVTQLVSMCLQHKLRQAHAWIQDAYLHLVHQLLQCGRGVTTGVYSIASVSFVHT